jgi:gas vesicle protein
MADSGLSEKFVYFLAGGCIGAAVALLFAPKTGEETREILGGKAKQSAEVLERKVIAGKEILQEKTQDVTSVLNETIEKGKETVTKQKEQLNQAIASGKKAYQKQKSKLQDA